MPALVERVEITARASISNDDSDTVDDQLIELTQDMLNSVEAKKMTDRTAERLYKL